MTRPPPKPPLSPSTTLPPSLELPPPAEIDERKLAASSTGRALTLGERRALARKPSRAAFDKLLRDPHPLVIHKDRKSTRLNSSHSQISYAVFCLKKKTDTT